MAKDPICGMDVNPETAIFRSVYEGKTYYFCNKSCKMTFDRNPKVYLESEKNGDGMTKKPM